MSLISAESILDEDISYCISDSLYSSLAPIDALANVDELDIAVEEATVPTETVKKENLFISWYNRIVINPSKAVFYKLIPKCTPGTQFEYLYPITMIWSLVLIFLVTYVISAVCQRWETLLMKVGFISFLPV